MKKILLLCVLVFFLLPSTALATNWQWIGGNDKATLFFDADTICYGIVVDPVLNLPQIDRSQIIFWEKIIITPQQAKNLAKFYKDKRYERVAYIIALHKHSTSRKTVTFYTETDYDYDGNIVLYFQQTHTYDIFPDSLEEKIHFAVRDYAHTHHAQLVRNAYNN